MPTLTQHFLQKTKTKTKPYVTKSKTKNQKPKINNPK
jgi:hypothetical protein